MLNIKSFNADGPDTASVVQTIVDSIKQDEAKLVVFFTSTKYDFGMVSKLMKENFPGSDVIGCTTSGEIGPQGFTEGSISAMSMAADNFETSTYLMKNIKNKAIFAKNDLVNAGQKIGISSYDSKNGFIITLIDGLQASEEKVMNILGNCFSNLDIVGGSAGDDLKFNGTFVSANGEVCQDAAVITFVRTSKKFFLYKENIYVPTDIEFKVTKADINNRLILELDGKPAAEEYARVLGISIDQLPDYFTSNPLGRIFMNSVWITSSKSVGDNGSINAYSAITQNSIVKLLKPIDAVAEAKKTVQVINEKLPDCKGIILFNCILRYLQFKKENICTEISSEFLKFGSVCGFNTYGEQFNKLHVNQTLALIAFGE